MNVFNIAMALIAWAVFIAASVAGMQLGACLPEAHRNKASQNVVSVSMAMVGTLTALVLGLLLSNANSSYTEAQKQLTSTASDLIRIDHLLRLYGPEADEARKAIRLYAAAMSKDVLPIDGRKPNIENEATLDLAAHAEDLIARLAPETVTKRWQQGRLIDVTNRVIQERFRLAKQQYDAIPTALMGLLIFWLALLFGSFGLYAPRHLTSLLVISLSSAAVAGALLLIIELEKPYGGLVHLSAEPLQHAIDVLSR